MSGIASSELNILYDILRDTEADIRTRLGLNVRLKANLVEPKKLNVRDYAVVLAEAMGSSLEELRTTSRKQHLVVRRGVAYTLIIQQYPEEISLETMAELFNRDHSTIIAGRDRAKALADIEDDLYLRFYKMAHKAGKLWLDEAV